MWHCDAKNFALISSQFKIKRLVKFPPKIIEDLFKKLNLKIKDICKL